MRTWRVTLWRGAGATGSLRWSATFSRFAIRVPRIYDEIEKFIASNVAKQAAGGEEERMEQRDKNFDEERNLSPVPPNSPEPSRRSGLLTVPLIMGNV